MCLHAALVEKHIELNEWQMGATPKNVLALIPERYCHVDIHTSGKISRLARHATDFCFASQCDLYN